MKCLIYSLLVAASFSCQASTPVYLTCPLKADNGKDVPTVSLSLNEETGKVILDYKSNNDTSETNGVFTQNEVAFKKEVTCEHFDDLCLTTQFTIDRTTLAIKSVFRMIKNGKSLFPDFVATGQCEISQDAQRKF